jgi:hypothetical protein
MLGTDLDQATSQTTEGRTIQVRIRAWLPLALVLLGSAFQGCGSEPSTFKAGGLYTVKDGKGGFKIAKVLVAEKGMVHVRLYKNAFPARPATVAPADLSLGSIKDKDGFGMGHLPLSLAAFTDWAPILLMESPVTEKELEGYKLWQEGGGGAFK